jgi:DNA-directed RNA polymerase subunit RPC12/RpoP
MSTQVSPTQAAPQDGDRFRCPHCGADDVRKVSLMYEQATSNLNFRALSMGDQGGASYTAGSGGIQNLMGGRVAPPTPPAAPKRPMSPTLAWIWLGLITFVTLLQTARYPAMMLAPSNASGAALFQGILSIALLFGLPIVWIVSHRIKMVGYQRRLSEYQNGILPTYQSQHARWARSWMCMRCGDLFERD